MDTNIPIYLHRRKGDQERGGRRKGGEREIRNACVCVCNLLEQRKSVFLTLVTIRARRYTTTHTSQGSHSSLPHLSSPSLFSISLPPLSSPSLSPTSLYL